MPFLGVPVAALVVLVLAGPARCQEAFENPAMLENFLGAFGGDLGQSWALSPAQVSGLREVSDSLLADLDQLTSRGAGIRRLNRMFAADIADVIATGDGGSRDAVVSGVAAAIDHAYKRTTGSEDPKFVEHTMSLVNKFLEEKAARK